MSETVLEILWYCVFIAVIGGYIILDGFDLGVGALHLTHRNDLEKRIGLNAIGPVWDGNEVWLVIIGGALFAGFPFAYATSMSAFYILVMILLAALILRAVSIEIRGKLPSKAWRGLFDVIFCLSSIGIAAGLGLTLGNLVHGIPLDARHEFIGNFGSFFHLYPILVAVLTLSACCMHGAIYLVMKTEGEMHDKMRKWVYPTMITFIMLYVATTMATLIYEPHMVQRFRDYPWLFLIAVASVIAIANIPRAMSRGKDGQSFFSSCISLALLVVLYAVGTFPYIVRSDIDPEVNSLTIYNSYASIKTLQILLIIVCIGIPLALAYIISVYYVFRGKVKIDSSSY